MKKERHQEILKEITEEIESALKDQRGLTSHQRRLAFSISLGMTEIIELYFHKLDVMKQGSKINHLWFKRKKQRIKEKLQQQITTPLDSIENIDEVINLAIKLEEKRDDLAYGVLASEKILQEKINLFLDLRKLTKC